MFFRETAALTGRRRLSCPVLTAPHSSTTQQKPYRNRSVNGLVYLWQRCRKAADRKATKDGAGMWTTAMWTVSAKGTRALLCCPCRAAGNATHAADFFLCEFHSPHHFDVRTRVCNDRVALAWWYKTWRAELTDCNTSNFDVWHPVLLFTTILVDK